MRAYKVTGISGEALVTEEVTTTIPSNTPVLINSNSDTDLNNPLNEESTATEDSYTVGLLTGVYVKTLAPVNSYVLQDGSDGVGFYKVADGNQPTVGANRCYLTVPATAKMLSFTDDEEITAIESLDVLTSGEYDAIYNAAGIQVEALQKGLNIVVKDGKSYKIYVK